MRHRVLAAGMINDAVKGLVTMAFGEEKWGQIHRR